MEGWISLHRRFLEWEWYTDTNTKSLFIHLLLKANIESKKWRGIDISRGELFTSLNHLSEDLNLSIKQVRNCLSKLKKTSEICLQGASNGTKITICKYEYYQDTKNARGKQMGKQGASKGQQLNKDNNIIKISLEFYQNEINANPDFEYLKQYNQFVSYISGNNDLKRQLDEILLFPNQLTCEQFKKLFIKSRDRVFTFKETVMTITNKKDYWYNKSSLYLTINGWINRSKYKK